MLVFAPGESAGFRESMGEALRIELAPLEERLFEDGEHKIRPLVDVRHQDVYIVARLAGSANDGVNDRLMRVLLLVATLRDAGAARVTVVAPYLPYARKDRRTKPQDPLTLRYLAALFEAMGTARMVVLDVHNVAAFENAFRCETVHLEARHAFAQKLAELPSALPLAVVSPDTGGVKRAELFRAAVEEATGQTSHLVFMEKHRTDDHVTGDAVVGRLDGCRAVIVDDLIAGGTTMARAAEACRQGGAAEVVAVASHGLFAGGAGSLLGPSLVDRLWVTNSVESSLLEQPPEHLQIIPVEPLLACAIKALRAPCD